MLSMNFINCFFSNREVSFKGIPDINELNKYTSNKKLNENLATNHYSLNGHLINVWLSLMLQIEMIFFNGCFTWIQKQKYCVQKNCKCSLWSMSGENIPITWNSIVYKISDVEKC